MRVHAGSNLTGRSLADSRLGAALGIGAMAVVRDDQPLAMPAPDTLLQADGLRMVTGRPKDVDLLSALTESKVEPVLAEELNGLEPEDFGLIEAAQERPNPSKAQIPILIMGAVLMTVMMGWLPIYLAAVIGAAVMVLTHHLTTEVACRALSGKASFRLPACYRWGVHKVALLHSNARNPMASTAQTEINGRG
jgi:hypothetical protein